MVDKLVITKNGVFEESFTPKELEEIKLEQEENERKQLEEEKLAKLQPSKEEVEDARIKIKSLEILKELELIPYEN